jgi:hypothetical protein
MLLMAVERCFLIRREVSRYKLEIHIVGKDGIGGQNMYGDRELLV